MWKGIEFAEQGQEETLTTRQALDCLHQRGFLRVSKADESPVTLTHCGRASFQLKLYHNSSLKMLCNRKEVHLSRFGFPDKLLATYSNLRMIDLFIQACTPCNTLGASCDILLSLYKYFDSEFCEPCRLKKNRDESAKRKHMVRKLFNISFLLNLE